jgi:hypothetical protein
MKNNLLPFSAMALLAVTGLTANSQSWLIAGNNNTNGENFIGTKNNQPLIFRTNNIERMRLTKNGQLGIGLTNPTYSLQVTNASFTTAIYGYTTFSAGNGIVGECDNGASAYGV